MNETSPQVARVCDFLRMFPSLRQMDQAAAASRAFCHRLPDGVGTIGVVAEVPRFPLMQVGASAVDYGQAMREIKEAAQRLLREIPSEHPVRQLLRIFAGSPQSAFDANEARETDMYIYIYIYSRRHFMSVAGLATVRSYDLTS